MKYPRKYEERTQRMSIRLPVSVKNHIWARAQEQEKSATDVVVDILTSAFKGKEKAPQWQPGTTKGTSHDQNEDVFA